MKLNLRPAEECTFDAVSLGEVMLRPSSTTEGERRQLVLSENIFLLDGTSGSA